MTTAPDMPVSPTMAIVLDAMMKDPREWRCTLDIAEATGSHPVTIRQNLGCLHSHGWVTRKPGPRNGSPRPRLYYKLTAAGVTRARKELAGWTIAQAG